MTRPTSRITKVVMTGPLTPFAESVRLELTERGYTARTAVHQLCQVARMSLWLDASRIGVSELNAERVEEFLAWQRVDGRYRSEWSRPGLICLLDVLAEKGVLRTCSPPPTPSPTEVLLASFEHHLLAERGLVTGTVRNYVDVARKFLEGLSSGIEIEHLSAKEVTDAVLRESAMASVSTVQNFVAGLRGFLRFCFLEGMVNIDLSQAALPVTGRRRSSLPRGITRADARALLAGCDRRSALGRRDHAVLIILLRLGLRAGEVAHLRLDDIDWRAGEVVVRGKGSRLDRLPLPNEVGQSIAAYLRRGRPTSDRREVFLRARAPFGPIAPGTVSSTVRRACQRAGVDEVGAHRLRHTVACEMVAAGVPLVEVAQVLRHRSLQTTAVYGRVDLDRLRLLAASWPGSAEQ
jgi:site-specific recombinase XerD